MSFFSLIVSGQENFKVDGYILDADSNLPVSDANIFIAELNKGATTNEKGYFSFILPPGKYSLLITYIGYQELNKEILINKNRSITISLHNVTESLDEVILQQQKNKKSRQELTMSVNKLDAETINKIPTVLGEKDVIKSLLLLPGVTNSGEGSGSINVRGGAGDQNLVLLDDALLFNESHLFGFFSIFNPDAVSSLELYKGGIPSNYGGRASSVIDITQKTGSVNDFKGNGGIGVVSSRLLLEGPISKGKSSFLVAGRTSYAHLFLQLIDNPNSAYFYDLNTKLNFLINENNTLNISGYFGRDVFNINETFKNTYGNALFNLNWDHQFSSSLSSDLSLIYSDYYFGLTLDFIGFNWNSGIDNFNLKYQLDHLISDQVSLNYGLQSIYYQINPGYIEPSRENSGIEQDQLTKKYAVENSLFIQANQTLGKFQINYGLRLNQFLRLGQDEINVYENDNPLLFNDQFQIYESAPIASTYAASKNEITESFVNLEPRFSISYELNENEIVKFNYQNINQYMHLLSNSDAPTPLDIWTPSGKYIQPQRAHQISLGYAKDYSDNTYSLETETFYKTVKNRIDYVDGAELIANNAIEQVILNGESRAYGLEVLFRKNKGKFTGWLAYTLSKSEQRTPGRTPNEPGINNGDWYNTGWDKTHDISLVGSYDYSKKWSFNASFVYQTGRPTTYPLSYYEFQGLNVPNYGKRNSDRLPAFHHLDISATLTPNKNKNRNWKTEWVFSIYNLYNRKNAASINFSKNDDTGRNEATRLAVFGIIPSISYNFKF